MNLKPIHNIRDHRNALKMIEALWNSKPGTPSGDRLEILTTLVEAFEAKRYPILPPDPIAAIRFRMEQLGLTNSDLAAYVGGTNRASEILSGKRALTVNMIRNLYLKLGIPPESLLKVA